MQAYKKDPNFKYKFVNVGPIVSHDDFMHRKEFFRKNYKPHRKWQLTGVWFSNDCQISATSFVEFKRKRREVRKLQFKRFQKKRQEYIASRATSVAGTVGDSSIDLNDIELLNTNPDFVNVEMDGGSSDTSQGDSDDSDTILGNRMILK